ncbi:MAG: hypothetical protein JWN93_164 [Hyphomicrobiales bacterium]|nr:hypothetical protein [Hyphomicrobiales bacterium]
MLTSARRMSQVATAAAALALGAGGAFAAPMTFRLADVGQGGNCGAKCVQVIVADGEIGESTPEDFAAFVRQQRLNPKARGVVFLNSPGGRVVASMTLGRMFRRAGAAVVVARVGQGRFSAAQCFSACVYALIGAKKRVVPPGSLVGIHRMFMYERFGGNEGSENLSRVYATPDLVDRLGDYAGTMGVSRELVYTAERVGSDQVHIVSPQEMRRWRLGVEKF